MSATRFEFDEFVLLPRKRLLLRANEEVPLIPRYFDLLVLLVERRGEAVTKEDIFDSVWSDVVVTDGALTQAVRILRKSLGDNAKEPRFIRTISRRGYRFVYQPVAESRDGDFIGGAPRTRPAASEIEAAKSLLAQAHVPRSVEEEEQLRDAAELVLGSGDEAAVAQLLRVSVARALLRDARWDLPGAATVPLVGRGGSLRAVWELVRLRFRGAMAVVAPRWLGAVAGGSIAGIVAGFLGGLALLIGPGSSATESVLVALPLVGMIAGGLGAIGVGGGIVWGERLIRSYRLFAVAVLGCFGGGAVGALAHGIAGLAFEGLFGRDLSAIGGGLEGLLIGATLATGYALATPLSSGGMATPRGRARVRVAAIAGVSCALGCLVLGLGGYHLGAMSLDLMAQSFPGSQVSLDPLARLLGETGPRAWTRGWIGGFEGLFFGFGVAFGVTRRR